MFDERIRRWGFWTLDFLKGRKISACKKHLEEIYNQMEPNYQALNELLRHAIDTVPAYQNVGKAEIHSFPVVSKDEYRKDFDFFRSRLFLDDSKLHKVYTSGSTGTPFMAYQNKEKLKYHSAGLIAMNERIGWNLGSRFMFLRIWGVSHTSGKLSCFMSNTVPADVMNLTDEAVRNIIQKIKNDKNMHLILGYASALESIAKYILQEKDKAEDLGIKLIISDSENLSFSAKQLIEKAFGCPVLNRYGNNENGILGLTGIDSECFEVNFPEYYVEILKLDSDQPASVGEIGRIVVTDLYNKAFPFIRYDTGDLGRAEEMHGEQCMVLKELSGRKSNVLCCTDGKQIEEVAVTALFENMTEIGRYQIIQSDAKTYRIVLENTAVSAENEILERFLNCVGKDAQVSFRHVEHIQQGKNGKFDSIKNSTIQK